MPQTRYRQFMILSGPRTGSHLLAQTLNAHSNVVCFREIFNGRLDFIQFSVDGYDDFSERDISRRKEHPIAFLQERIFCDWPANIGAVGFKFHYTHHWDFPGLLDYLQGDDGLAVIHLRRRNTLRQLVSVKMAERTGVWLQESDAKVTSSRALSLLRRPDVAFRRIQRRLRRAPQAVAPSKPKVTIAPDEFDQFLLATAMREKTHVELYREHPRLDVDYLDLTERRDETLGCVFEFLGVRPERVTSTLRRQNPESLRDLIENYDELYIAFKDRPEAMHFDE